MSTPIMHKLKFHNKLTSYSHSICSTDSKNIRFILEIFPDQLLIFNIFKYLFSQNRINGCICFFRHQYCPNRPTSYFDGICVIRHKMTFNDEYDIWTSAFAHVDRILTQKYGEIITSKSVFKKFPF